MTVAVFATAPDPIPRPTMNRAGRFVVGLLVLLGLMAIAGGAALKMASPGNLNVDFVCDSAFDAVNWLDNVGCRQE